MGSLTEDNEASRILATLDLMEFGIELQRQNIVRKNPNLTEEQINQLLQNWINESSLTKNQE